MSHAQGAEPTGLNRSTAHLRSQVSRTQVTTRTVRSTPCPRCMFFTPTFGTRFLVPALTYESKHILTYVSSVEILAEDIQCVDIIAMSSMCSLSVR